MDTHTKAKPGLYTRDGKGKMKKIIQPNPLQDAMSNLNSMDTTPDPNPNPYQPNIRAAKSTRATQTRPGSKRRRRA